MKNHKKFITLKTAKEITDNQIVTLTKMNHLYEIVNSERNSNILECYRKIDESHFAFTPDGFPKGIKLRLKSITIPKTGNTYKYVEDEETGKPVIAEVREFNTSENRLQNITSLKRTMKKIRHLINNNFTGAKNELFITLTYRPNPDSTPMDDIKKASRDYDVFIKRLKRRYPDLEYLAILEPQGNTAWHWHILCKFKNWQGKRRIFICNKEIVTPLWGHGSTDTRAIRTKKGQTPDNIGAYFTPYFTDLVIDDENMEQLFDTVYKNSKNIDIVEKEVIENGKKKNKRFIKGGRLHLYPIGTNIFRKSKGITYPESEKMTYGEAKEIIGDIEPQYKKTISVISLENFSVVSLDNFSDEEITYIKTLNKITYESYNLKRKGKRTAKEKQLKKYKDEITSVLTAKGYKPEAISLAEKTANKIEIYFNIKNVPFELPPNFDDRFLDSDDFEKAIFVKYLNDDNDFENIMQYATEIIEWSKDILPKSHYTYAPERTMREWNEQQNT